jgi:imidazolonepropionase-like amidohydrolase
MKSIRSNALAIPSLLLAALFYCPAVGAQAKAKPIVFKGARLIDGTGRAPVEDSVLIIEGSKIRAVGKAGSVRTPKGAEVRDVSGKTIMPALVALHCHLGLTSGIEQAARNYTEENIRGQLEEYLAYGVGTVMSLGQDQDLIYKLREDQRAGQLPGARLFTAGRGFGANGGLPGQIVNAVDRYRPQTPEEARADVRELAQNHPDFVKFWLDDDLGRVQKIQLAVYRAIIEEGHRQHLRVIAHEFYLADAKALVDAGIDGLAHSIRDEPVDNELITAMKSRGVFLIPTLVRDESMFVYAENPEWLDDAFFQAGLSPGVLTTLQNPSFKGKFRMDPYLAKRQAAFEIGKKNLKILEDAGVKIGFGTDSGPALRFPGFFEHRELRLMVEAGLTPMQAIVAATGTSAGILGAAKEFGTLERGKQADFLVLDANPLEDIHNKEKLSAVWQAGRMVRSIPGGGHP